MKWSESTISQLGLLGKNMKGCPFWEEVIEEYQSNGKWSSDDSQEAFYERYLVSLPDEWSKSEKQKSHGEGVMGPHEESNLAVYSKRFFTCFSRYAWHLFTAMNPRLIQQTSSNPLHLISLLPPPLPITKDMLHPVRRQIII
jgi:hypothetical protein